MNLSFILITLMSLSAFNQPDSTTSYEAIMKEHIEMLNNASTIGEMQEAANGFFRVSQVHTDEWLPRYYTALAYANMGYMSIGGVDDKDAYFIEAEKHLESAGKLSENNSEIITLKGYSLMGKLNADPVNRGQRLSPRILQLYNKARQLNPENPRAVVLSARMEFGMSSFMGQDTSPLCERIFASKELFSQETVNTLLPSWGEYILKDLLEECK